MNFNDRQNEILTFVLMYYLANFETLNDSIFPEPYDDPIIAKTKKSELEGIIKTMWDSGKSTKGYVAGAEALAYLNGVHTIPIDLNKLTIDEK